MRGLMALVACLVLGWWSGVAAAQPDATAEGAYQVAQAASPLPVPESQIPLDGQPDAAAPAEPSTDTPEAPASDAEDLTQPDPNAEASDDSSQSSDDLSLGEIPVIETVELTPEMARKALDVYLLVKDKYQNSDLDQFENLQDFVDQSSDGKAFEADVKGAGFADVNAWNIAITSLTFGYSSAIDDPSAEILQQISEIEQDGELAQDMKDRMISSLRAMIPSENNKKIVADMLDDPDYAAKLKQLELEEE